MLIQIRGIKETPKYNKPDEKYWKLETDKGDMSCFEENVVKALYEAWRADKEIEVNAKQSDDGKYMNIRGLGKDKAETNWVKQEQAEYEKPAEVVKPQSFEAIGLQKKDGFNVPNTQFNPTSMYVSYAKDIFIDIYEYCKKESQNQMPDHDIMELAINLVKQAHKEFS